jgi:hypothetical protein
MLRNNGAHAFHESFTAELLGMSTDVVGIPRMREELRDTRLDGVCLLLHEKNSGLLGDYGIEGATGMVGQYGAACGHGLEGCDAEIFFTRKKEATTARKER